MQSQIGDLVYRWWRATLNDESAQQPQANEDDDSSVGAPEISPRRRDVEFYLVQKLIERSILSKPPYSIAALKVSKSLLIC